VVSTQVQYAATASSSCRNGVSAMGIYTAPGVLAYVVSGASLNATLTLNPGNYNTVVQEGDNCGGTAKTPVTIKVTRTQAGWSGHVDGPRKNTTGGRPPVQFRRSGTE